MVDFLGIGAQKGGTTWLFHQLSKHPQIEFPAGKEFHFWNRADPSLVDHWFSVLEPASRYTADGRPVRTGEITPAYSIIDVEAITSLQAKSPDIRLFIVLRNPMERAWSAAMMNLARVHLLSKDIPDQWFLDHLKAPASWKRGAYTSCIERWWSVFPREQLLILFYDDIKTSPSQVLTSLARHIRIDEAYFATLSSEELATVVVPDIKADYEYKIQQGTPPRPSLIPLLCELYAPEIESLSSLLGRNFSPWIDEFLNGSRHKSVPRIEVSTLGSGRELVRRLTKEKNQKPTSTLP